MKRKHPAANIILLYAAVASLIVWAPGCNQPDHEIGDFIAIDTTGMKASLPEVIYNDIDKTFLVVWQSQQGLLLTDNRINCRILSGDGTPASDIIVLAEGSTARLLPRAAYNPFTGECMIIFGMLPPGRTDLDVYGMIIDSQAQTVVSQFPVCTNPANQIHTAITFNTISHEYLISYNDARNGKDNGDIIGVIFDEDGQVSRPEFTISSAPGNQINPFVCHNPIDNTYLVNWEDFRNEQDYLKDPGNIMGALLDQDGNVLVDDIAMCADTDAADEGDQRFNNIAYNPDKNEFLASWSDTRPSLQNAAVAGRIITAEGALGSDLLALADGAGAQMIGQVIYAPEAKKYFMVYEHDDNDLDVLYFMDTAAQLDIYARWFSDNGTSEGAAIPICREDGNQRFTKAAYNADNGSFCVVWQDDFPISSATRMGHMMSAGGNILGAIYKQ